MAEIYALTGGVGAGKSTVLKMFAQMGVQILSADEIVHTLYCDQDIQGELKTLFGPKVILQDGSINKKELARIIFTDPEQRHKLENMIHPRVIQQVQDQAHDKIVICEVPLYFEMQAKYRDMFSGVIFVTTTFDNQTQRATLRGHGNSYLQERQKAKVKDTEVLNLADFVIVNDGSLQDLYAQASKVLQSIQMR